MIDPHDRPLEYLKKRGDNSSSNYSNYRDKRLDAIQKSTRPFIHSGSWQRLIEKLRLRFKWYYYWRIDPTYFYDDLDKQMFAIQQSTRTTFKRLQPLNEILRLRLRWYYKWHIRPISNKIHLGTLVLFIAAMVIGTSYGVISNNHPAYAVASCTATVSGTWHDNGGNATWTGSGCTGTGGTPASTAAIVVNTGVTVTLDGAASNTSTFTLNTTTGTLNTAGYTFSTGAFTDGGVLTTGASTITLSSLSISLGRTLNANNGSTINISGNFANLGTMTASATSTINFTGTSGTQTLNANGTGATRDFYNLTHSGAGTLQITNTAKVANNFTNSAGIFDENGYAFTVTGTFSNNNGTFSMKGTESPTITNDSTHGTVQYTATTGTNAIKNWTYNNLKINGSGGTFTQPAALVVNGTFNLAAGTYQQGANQNLSVAGNFTIVGTFTKGTGTSTLIFNGNLTFTGPATPQDLGAVQAGASPNTITLASDFSASSLTIPTTDIFNTMGYEVTVTGTISITGTMDTTDNGTAGYEGDGSIITTGGNFTVNGGGVFTKCVQTSRRSKIVMNSGAAKTLTSNAQDLGDFQTSVASTSIALQDALNVDALTIDASTTLDDSGNFAITVSANWTNAGTFTSGTGTVTFDSTSTGQTINPGASNGNFYNLTFNGSGGAWSPLTNAIIVTNDLTMTAGTFDTSSGTANVTVNGNVACNTTCGTINMTTTNTFTQNVASSKAFGTSVAGTTAWTFYNLLFSSSAGTPTITTSTTGSGDITTKNGLLIYSSTTLDAGNRTWHIQTATDIIPFYVGKIGGGTYGTLTANTSTFSFEGTSTTTIASATYYNLQTSPASGTLTYTLGTSYTTGTPCFLAGTKVLVNQGEAQNIEDLKAGDAVLSYDMNTHQPALSHITEVTNSPTGYYYLINGKVKATTNHVFIMADYSQKKVGDLRVGDVLATYTGTEAIKTIERIDQQVTVYNIEVANYHLFYADGYLVHNATVVNPVTVNNNFTLAGAGAGTVDVSVVSPDLTVNGDVSIGSGQTLIASATAAFNAKGNWTNAGTFTHSSGTVSFTGTATGKTINPGASNGNFYNLTFNGSGGAWSPLTNTVTVTNNLTMTAGTFDTSNGTANVVVNGTVAGTAGVINMTTTNTFTQRIGAANNFGTTSGSTNWTFNNLNFENSSAGDLTITTPGTATGQIIISGTLTVGNASDTNKTTLDNETNDRIIDANGAVNITSKGALTASSTASFTVAGNWTNSGTFTSGTGTVTLDGASSQTVTANGTDDSHDFYNLTITNANATGVSFADSMTIHAGGTFTDATGDSHITFHAGSTYTIPTLVMNGASSHNIIVRSSTPGSYWNLNVTNAPTLTYVDAQDSDAHTGALITANTSSNSGHNNHWDFGAGSVVYLSGTVYTLEDKSTNLGSAKNVSLSVNGAAKTTVATTTGGVFAFTVPVATNNTLTFFVDDGVVGDKGNLVTQALNGTSDITGLEMYTGDVSLRHESAGPMTNTLLATAATLGDSYMIFSVSGGNATFAGKLWIESGYTYTPGGTVTTTSLEVRGTGTFSPGANAVSVTGNWTMSGTGTFTTSGTVTFNGSDAYAINGTAATQTFYNLVVAAVGGNYSVGGSTTTLAATNFTENASGGNFTPPATFNVSGVVTLTAGTFTAGANITVGGNWTNNGGTFTQGTNTVTFNGNSAAINGTAATQTFYNLIVNKTAGQLLSVSGSTTTLAATNVTETTGNFTPPATFNIAGTLTLTAGTFTGGTNVNIAGDWTNNGGTFTPGSNTVTFTGNSSSINGSAASQTFAKLIVNKTAGQLLSCGGSTTTLSTLKFTETTGNFTAPASFSVTGTSLTGNLLLTAGTFTAGANISLAGSWSNSGGTFTPGTNTVTFTGSSSYINGSAATQTFYDIIINKTAGQALTPSGSLTTLAAHNFTETTGNFTSPATFNVSGTVTLTAGTFTAGTNTNIGGDWTNNGGTFTPNSHTVTFNGTGSQAINGSAASQTFYILIVAKTAGQLLSVSGSTTTLTVTTFTETTGNFTAPAAFNISGDLTLTAGTFTAGASVYLNGAGNSWINNGGTFTPGTSIVYFSGSGIQYIKGTAASQTFYNFELTCSGTVTVGGSTTTLTINNLYPTTGDFNPPATFNVNGTFNWGGGTITAGANINVAGNWSKTTGTFIAGTNTVTFNGTASGKTIDPGASSGNFYNLIFNGSGGEWSPLTHDVTVTNDLTMIAGTFNTAAGTANVTVNGNIACSVTCGTISMTSTNTFTQNVAAAKNFGTSVSGTTAWEFNNLIFSSSSGSRTITTSTAATGNITIDDTLTIGASTTLDAGNRTWILAKVVAGAPPTPTQINWLNRFVSHAYAATDIDVFIATGTLTGNASTFKYTATNGDGYVHIAAAGYYSLETAGTDEGYVLTGNTTLLGNLTIDAGTMLDASSSNYSLTVYGNWANNGTFTPQSGTVTFRGTGATAITGNSNSFYDLVMNANTDGAKTITFPTGSSYRQIISHTWTLSGGSGKVLTLRSASSSTAWYFDIPSGFTAGVWVDVADSWSYSDNSKKITPGANTTDTGTNNAGWAFGISLSVDNASLNFGSLLPGDVFTGNTQTTVTVNYLSGYSLSISDNISGSDSALLDDDGVTRITDYAGTFTTPTTWSGTGLGVCPYVATGKDTSKWGTGTTVSDSLNKYAGIPQTAATLFTNPNTTVTNDTANIGYKIVVPSTQKTGVYSGLVTYTATATLP